MPEPLHKPESPETRSPGRLVAACQPVAPQIVMDAVEAAGFSADAYLASNPDVLKVAPGARQAVRHFIEHGFAERRRFAVTLSPDGIRALLALPIINRTYVTQLAAALTRAYTSDPDLDVWIESGWPMIEQLRPAGARPFLLFGTSEARSYAQASVRGEQWLVPLSIITTGAAAMGLSGLREPSAIGPRIMRTVEIIGALPGGRTVPCLFKFGQVDAEFAFNLKRMRDGTLHYAWEDFRRFSERSVARYADFLASVAKRIDPGLIAVASVFPSSVSDEAWAAGFMRAHSKSLRNSMTEAEIDERVRGLEIPDQWERARMTRHYNNLLRECADSLSLRYYDDCEILLNAYGLLDKEFLYKSKGQDCHLDIAPGQRNLELLLWNLVGSDPYCGNRQPASDPQQVCVQIADSSASISSRGPEPLAAMPVSISQTI